VTADSAGDATIPFSRPRLSGREAIYLSEALAGGKLAGAGPFSRRCEKLLETETGAARVLLTHSATAALEMACLLIDLRPGDEVIMPSFAFVSSANAVALRGAVPVFADIRIDTLNLDEARIEAALTPNTRAIMPVHYAGVACDMAAISAIAARRGLSIIEDAAQAIGASWQGRPLGSIGRFGALSFHETKNVMAGEGGALMINDGADAARAAIILEKGTNRQSFLAGAVDKYTWCDVGSSFTSNELSAAVLLAQLEELEAINQRRLALWRRYHDALAPAEAAGRLRRPVVPEGCAHNGHIYYVLLDSAGERQRVLAALRQTGIHATFHYVPLHDSPGGRRFGRSHGSLAVTEDAAARLLRLPLYPDLSDTEQDRVLSALLAAAR
jgi:dTDP-4-amino-4,6-dideoxygalactose transaminase